MLKPYEVDGATLQKFLNLKSVGSHKMAATAKMAHQNSRKLGNMAQDCFTDGVVDHDMHLKMSKKIAQLTKVIIIGGL